VTITDDEIISLWRTVRPSAEQNAAMTWNDSYNKTSEQDCPSYELRRLVELAIDHTESKQKEADVEHEERRRLLRWLGVAFILGMAVGFAIAQFAH